MRVLNSLHDQVTLIIEPVQLGPLRRYYFVDTIHKDIV